ncbi:hypothetical protein C0Q63_00035 [Streptomyces albidoflavus]|nr:hypothetical protein C0Q63_00035 [Streptomyces albidoflavus]
MCTARVVTRYMHRRDQESLCKGPAAKESTRTCTKERGDLQREGDITGFQAAGSVMADGMARSHRGRPLQVSWTGR